MRLTTQGLSVHHVVPISQDEDRKLDEGNLVTLCGWHHRQAEAGMIAIETLIQWIREAEKRAGE